MTIWNWPVPLKSMPTELFRSVQRHFFVHTIFWTFGMPSRICLSIWLAAMPKTTKLYQPSHQCQFRSPNHFHSLFLLISGVKVTYNDIHIRIVHAVSLFANRTFNQTFNEFIELNKQWRIDGKKNVKNFVIVCLLLHTHGTLIKTSNSQSPETYEKRAKEEMREVNEVNNHINTVSLFKLFKLHIDMP